MAKHTKKHSSSKASKSKKAMPSVQGRGYCVKCKNMVDMVNVEKVPMKGARSKTMCRLKGKDMHGHNVSAFVKC
jgi:hypothetical protein